MTLYVSSKLVNNITEVAVEVFLYKQSYKVVLAEELKVQGSWATLEHQPQPHQGILHHARLLVLNLWYTDWN